MDPDDDLFYNDEPVIAPSAATQTSGKVSAFLLLYAVLDTTEPGKAVLLEGHSTLFFPWQVVPY